MSWTALTTQPQCEGCGTIMRELFSSLYCPNSCKEAKVYTAYISKQNVFHLAKAYWYWDKPTMLPTVQSDRYCVEIRFTTSKWVEYSDKWEEYDCAGDIVITYCDHPAWTNRKKTSKST